MFGNPFSQITGGLADVRHVRVAADTIILIDYVGLQVIWDAVFVWKKVLEGILIGEYEPEINLGVTGGKQFSEVSSYVETEWSEVLKFNVNSLLLSGTGLWRRVENSVPEVTYFFNN